MYQGTIRTIRQNWDELGIAAALGHLAFSGEPVDMERYGYIVEALRRSRTDLQDASLEDIRSYLSGLDESGIPGLVNNVKGIANEIYYVEAENEDGDPVQAHLFGHTNQKDYDVVLHNAETGEERHVQLKATDDTSYVQAAIDNVGEDRIVVTQELADRMGLENTGLSNGQLTADVDGVVRRLIDDESLWDYVPALSLWSVALVISSLARRWHRREITRQAFVRMTARFTGLKLAKTMLLVAALSVPGLNVVVGAALVVKLLLSLQRAYR